MNFDRIRSRSRTAVTTLWVAALLQAFWVAVVPAQHAAAHQAEGQQVVALSSTGVPVADPVEDPAADYGCALCVLLSASAFSHPGGEQAHPAPPASAMLADADERTTVETVDRSSLRARAPPLA